MEAKSAIRYEALRLRNNLDSDCRLADVVADKVWEEVERFDVKTAGIYFSKDKEFDSFPIIEMLLKQQIKVSLPITPKEKAVPLKFAVWDGTSELVKGKFEVMEPRVSLDTKFIEPDLLIVPLLAFDRAGHRIGYGGGYYDATISALRERKKIVCVGLAHDQQLCLFNLPVEEHDQKLDMVITPTRVHKFT